MKISSVYSGFGIRIPVGRWISMDFLRLWGVFWFFQQICGKWPLVGRTWWRSREVIDLLPIYPIMEEGQCRGPECFQFPEWCCSCPLANSCSQIVGLFSSPVSRCFWGSERRYLAPTHVPTHRSRPSSAGGPVSGCLGRSRRPATSRSELSPSRRGVVAFRLYSTAKRR